MVKQASVDFVGGGSHNDHLKARTYCAKDYVKICYCAAVAVNQYCAHL